MNEEKTSLIAKLLMAQGSMPSVSRTSDNPFFHSKYAPLNEIWARVIPVLNSVGLVYYETTEVWGELGTILVGHVADADSGEEIVGKYPVVADSQKAQALGSGLTYARRYLITTMLGIVFDDDDDGNAASGMADKQGPPPRQDKQGPPPGRDKSPEETSLMLNATELGMAEFYARLSLMNTLGNYLNAGEQANAPGLEPASDAQYRFLSGTIDKIAGWEGAHNQVLSIIANHPVDSEHKTSKAFTSSLLDVLLEHKKQGDQWVDNPKFSPAQVNNIKVIADAFMNEASKLEKQEEPLF